MKHTRTHLTRVAEKTTRPNAMHRALLANDDGHIGDQRGTTKLRVRAL